MQRLWKISWLHLLLFVCLLTGCQQKEHGYQGYIEGRYTYIAPYSAGYVLKKAVREGDRVQAGQLLFQLSPNPEAEQLREAQFKLQAAEQTLQDLSKGSRQTVLAGLTAQVREAQASLKFARQTLRRDQTLLQRKAIGRAQLDQSLSNYRRALQRVTQLQAQLAEAKLGGRSSALKAQQANVAAARADVKRLQWLVDKKNLYAPKEAYVFDTFFRKGEYVPAGQPVVALLPPGNIKLLFYVPEPVLSQLKIGQQIWFNCDGCQKTQAKIAFISPQAEYTPPVIFSQETRAKLVYRVEARMPKAIAKKFNPGQPVTVYLTHE